MTSPQYLQKCYVSTGSRPTTLTIPRELVGSSFEKGGFLNSNGTDTGYFYGATGNILAVFKSNVLYCTIDFGASANVIDCCYFALNDKCPGLLVAVNDPTAEKHFYVAYVSLTKKEIIRKVSSVGSINSIATMIDGATYPSHVDLLSETFKKNWPHVAAISVYSIGAVLFHLGITDEDSPDPNKIHRPANTIVLGRAFYSKEAPDTFNFQADDGKYHKGSKKEFFVTAMSFMPSCGVVLLGFNFGGIYMVSLRTQRPYAHFFCEGVIEGIIETHADDDPRGGFYLWFLITRNDRASAISCNVAWTDEHFNAKDFNNPMFLFGLNFMLPRFMQFVNVKTIQTDRNQLAASPVSAELNDSNPNPTLKSSSLSMITWINSETPAKLYGCIFDMNQYYYKRLPRKLISDRTSLKQVPCCAGFYSDESIDLTQIEILDLQVIPESVHPFVSVGTENTDQLFYPSVYTMKMKVLTRDAIQSFTIDSIQRQHLKECSDKFEENWKNPAVVCIKSHALGLADLPYEANDPRYYLLTMLLKHRFHQCIREFILRESTSNEDLKFVARWLNKEVDVAKITLDKSCETLLQGGGISHTSLKYINCSHVFFFNVSSLLKTLVDRAESQGQHELAKNYRIAQTVSNGLNLYSMGIDLGIELKMLPHTVCFAAANAKLREKFRERVQRSADKLAVIRLIEECVALIPDSEIWDGKAADKWYPPTDFSAWLGVLINVNLSIVAKTVLFGYYLCDVEACEVFPVKKWIYTIETLLCPTHPEKLKVVKDRIQKMYNADTSVVAVPENPQDQKLRAICEAALADEAPPMTTAEDFATLPLTSNQLVEEAREKFLSLPDGLHHWNINVIKKRRYELIVPAEFPRGEESAVAKQSRALVTDIKNKFPFLFVDNADLINKVRQWASTNQKTGTEEPMPAEQTTPKAAKPFRLDHKRKRSDVIVEPIDDDEFRLATPVKRKVPVFVDTPAAKSFRRFTEEDMLETPKENRTEATTSKGDVSLSPVVNSELDNNAVSQKQWERIRMITRTPPSTPLVSRTMMMSPEPSAVKQPTSILKSNKKKPRFLGSVKKPRLQFNDVISEVKSIPNRHEEKAPQPDHFTTVDSFNSSMEIQDDEDFTDEPSSLNFDAPGPMDDDFPEEEFSLPASSADGSPIVSTQDEDGSEEEREESPPFDLAAHLSQSFEEQEDEPMETVERTPTPESVEDDVTPEESPSASVLSYVGEILEAASVEVKQERSSQESSTSEQHFTLPNIPVVETSFEEQDPDDFVEDDAEAEPEPSSDAEVVEDEPERPPSPVERDYSIEAPEPPARDYPIEVPVVIESSTTVTDDVVERSFEEQASEVDDDEVQVKDEVFSNSPSSVKSEMRTPPSVKAEVTTPVSTKAEVVTPVAEKAVESEEDVNEDDEVIEDDVETTNADNVPEGGDASVVVDEETEGSQSPVETIGERVHEAHVQAELADDSIGARVRHAHEAEVAAETQDALTTPQKRPRGRSETVSPAPDSQPSLRRSARARKPVITEPEAAPAPTTRATRRVTKPSAAVENTDLSEASRDFLSRIRTRPARGAAKSSSATDVTDSDSSTTTRLGRKTRNSSLSESVDKDAPAATPTKRARKTPSREPSVEPSATTPVKRTRKTPSREPSVEPPTVTPSKRTRKTPSREVSVEPEVVTPRRSTRSRTKSVESVDLDTTATASKRKVAVMTPIAETEAEAPPALRRTPRKKN
uniref:ELYS-bb domain-containing protein n=1 Tax=Panagrellus redivivus TaxID=6233 RepID=A0A7E4VR76_PANRE